MTDTRDDAPELFAARICKGMPSDCCDYAVVSLTEGAEVCRVWTEGNARRIASLLNRRADTPAAQVTVAEADYSSLVERLRSTSSRCHLAIAWKAMDEAADAIIALQGERDRQYDENANRIAAQAKAEAALARAIPADGSTIEAMRAALLDTPAGKSLNSKGDVRIYWLNEGDVNTAALRALTGEGRA